MTGRWGQILPCAQQQDKGQWVQSGSQEARAEYEEKCLYFVGDIALQQGAQKGCGVSLLS